MDRRQAYKLRHKEAGLCIACTQKATHGNMCRTHWMLQKIVKRRYRLKLLKRQKDAGLCTGCGIPLDPDSDALTVCVNCASERLKPERGRNKR